MLFLLLFLSVVHMQNTGLADPLSWNAEVQMTREIAPRVGML